MCVSEKHQDRVVLTAVGVEKVAGRLVSRGRVWLIGEGWVKAWRMEREFLGRERERAANLS